MNTSRFLAYLVFLILSTPCLAASRWSMADGPDYFKIGAGWDVSDKYSGTTLELQSPGVAFRGAATNEFNIVATYSTLRVDNLILDDDSNKYKSSYNSTESIGLGWRVQSSSAPLAAYIHFGAIHMDADRGLAQFDHPKWGTRFTFGFEYPVVEQSMKSSFFIQETMISGLGRANQIAHDPDLFNGTSLSFGARIWI